MDYISSKRKTKIKLSFFSEYLDKLKIKFSINKNYIFIIFFVFIRIITIVTKNETNLYESLYNFLFDFTEEW